MELELFAPVVVDRDLLNRFIAPLDLIKRFLFDRKTTQFISVNKARIQSDFVGKIEQDLFLWSVAEQNSERKLVRIANKLGPNPIHFCCGLFF